MGHLGLQSDIKIFLCRMLKLCVVLLATFVSLSTAFGPPGYFSEFSLLRCMVANPRAGQRDQPDTKEEPIPVLPFHVVYDDFGTWFQPVTSQTCVEPMHVAIHNNNNNNNNIIVESPKIVGYKYTVTLL